MGLIFLGLTTGLTFCFSALLDTFGFITGFVTFGFGVSPSPTTLGLIIGLEGFTFGLITGFVDCILGFITGFFFCSSPVSFVSRYSFQL